MMPLSLFRKCQKCANFAADVWLGNLPSKKLERVFAVYNPPPAQHHPFLPSFHPAIITSIQLLRHIIYTPVLYTSSSHHMASFINLGLRGLQVCIPSRKLPSAMR